MLIKFDPELVTFQKVKVKRVTTALGGSVTVLDEAHFARTGKEIFHKIDCPVAVARAFGMKHGMSAFLKPAETCLSFYDGRIISIELAPAHLKNERFTQGLFEDSREWLSQSEANFRVHIRKQLAEGVWYFDGLYVYKFAKDNLLEAVADSKPLIADGSFRDVRCTAVNLSRLYAGSESLSEKQKQKSAEDALAIEERSCLGFALGEISVVSPPIWKDLSNVHDRKMKGRDIDTTEDGVFDSAATLSTMDDKLFVNLQFALTAGKEISQAFGYDKIAPLQFPKLMIQLRTVNLPAMVKEIKATHNIGMKFTHALAWLLGLLHTATGVDQMNAIRRMLKYLTTKGVYRAASMDEKNVRHEAVITTEAPPMMSFDDAILNLKTLPPSELKGALEILTGNARAKATAAQADMLSLDGIETMVV